MYFDEAIQIKKSISSEFIRRKRVFILAVGGANQDFAYSSLNDQLCEIVNGVSILQRDGNWMIKIFVDGDISESTLCNRFDIDPKDLMIVNTGEIAISNLMAKCDPIHLGASVSHYKVGAGTLGCIVKEPASPDAYILSNNHVLANSNKCKLSDAIIQPGVSDGGKHPGDKIAELHNFVPIGFSLEANSVDCAIAKITTDVDVDTQIPDFGRNLLSGAADSAEKMKVFKYGRSSGYTTGYVASNQADIKVVYEKGGLFSKSKVAFFEDQIEIKGYDFEKKSKSVFSRKGDSGALIIENQTFRSVGLLFCNASDGTTFANPIKKVLALLNVEFV